MSSRVGCVLHCRERTEVNVSWCTSRSVEEGFWATVILPAVLTAHPDTMLIFPNEELFAIANLKHASLFTLGMRIVM